jgi:hypothetical protein
MKSRARLKCRSAAGEFRPGFDDVWEIKATTAESNLLLSVRLPNSWLHLFLKDHKRRARFKRRSAAEESNLKIQDELTEPQSSRQLLQQSLHFFYLPREGRVAGQVFQFERVA